MDLSLIRGALEECRQVVLPGYGAFLRSDSDAHGALQLTFTPFILRSDGAFESYISSSQGVDSVSASQMAHKLAAYVRQQIESAGYCNIDGLGSLRREANGMVLFNPETVQVTAGLDSGSVSLSSEGACGSSVVSAEDLCESDRPIANPELGEEEIASPPAEDERYANCAIPPVVAEPFSHAHHGRKRWRWMVWAMLGVGVCAYAVWHFGLVGSISSLWDRYWHFSEIAKFDNPLVGRGGAALGTAKPIEPSQTPSTEDTSLKRAYDAMDGQSAPSSQSVSERVIPARGKLPSADPDLPYHIVWGSFSTRDKAEGHARQMLKEGFQAQVLPSEDGVMRVVLSSFSTQEHALQSLAAVRQRYADAWLHSQ